MSVEELIDELSALQLKIEDSRTIMDERGVQALLTTAIEIATERTSRSFQTTVDDLTKRLKVLETLTQVEAYQPITINPNVECNESLDIIKSIPEFNGNPPMYVSWRQVPQQLINFSRDLKAAPVTTKL